MEIDVLVWSPWIMICRHSCAALHCAPRSGLPSTLPHQQNQDQLYHTHIGLQCWLILIVALKVTYTPLPRLDTGYQLKIRQRKNRACTFISHDGICFYYQIRPGEVMAATYIKAFVFANR